jgi:TctA family transporter
VSRSPCTESQTLCSVLPTTATVLGGSPTQACHVSLSGSTSHHTPTLCPRNLLLPLLDWLQTSAARASTGHLVYVVLVLCPLVVFEAAVAPRGQHVHDNVGMREAQVGVVLGLG